MEISWLKVFRSLDHERHKLATKLPKFLYKQYRQISVLKALPVYLDFSWPVVLIYIALLPLTSTVLLLGMSRQTAVSSAAIMSPSA